jgi:PAS domain S-box-containing protein
LTLAKRLTEQLGRNLRTDARTADSVAYFITDRAGKIERANQSAQVMLNCREEQLIGISLVMYIPLDRRREFRDRISQFAQSNVVQVTQWDLEMQISPDATLPVRVSVRSMNGLEGSSLCWTVRNMAEFRQLQAKESVV